MKKFITLNNEIIAIENVESVKFMELDNNSKSLIEFSMNDGTIINVKEETMICEELLNHMSDLLNSTYVIDVARMVRHAKYGEEE